MLGLSRWLRFTACVACLAALSAASPSVRAQDESDRPVGTAPLRRSDGARAEFKTRVYLLDLSTGHAPRVRAETERAFKSLELRRDVAFDLLSLGDGDWLRGERGPLAVSDKGLEQGRSWLAKERPVAQLDLHARLVDVFERGPDVAVLVVASAPVAPANVETARIEREGGLAAFLAGEVATWRRSGKGTVLDIVGIGLSGETRALYKKLARATGGTYIDGQP